jgi:hypothetical protein
MEEIAAPSAPLIALAIDLILCTARSKQGRAIAEIVSGRH